MDQEDIMSAYYNTVDYKVSKNNSWVTKFSGPRQGTRLLDLVDAATGKVVAEAGKKVTPRAVKKLKDDGRVTELVMPFNSIVGKFVSKDMINRGKRRHLCGSW